MIRFYTIREFFHDSSLEFVSIFIYYYLGEIDLLNCLISLLLIHKNHRFKYKARCNLLLLIRLPKLRNIQSMIPFRRSV